MPTINGNIHYVKFIRSSAAAWANLLLTPAKIDDDTLYFIYEASDTTKGKLYLGQRLISGVEEGDSSSINISDIGGIYIDDETLGNKQILVYNEANDQWKNTPLSDIIGEAVSVMTGATAAADGVAGLVPQPKADQQVNFLRGDGTWAPINIPGFDSSVLIPNSQNQITLTGIEQAAIGTIPVKTTSGIEWRQQSSEQLNRTIVTMEQLNDLIANEDYDANTIYMVSKSNVEDNSDCYDEYLVINNQAERLGTFGTVNLSDYVTNTVFENRVGNLENILNDKIDSETGNLTPGLVTRFETLENSNLRDPGYGKITPGAASTATEAIIANTTQIAAGTYNENLNINPGNKWVQIGATSGASNSEDTLTLGHALSDVTAGISSPNTAQTPNFNTTFNIPTVTVDEAGHVTAMGTTTVKIPDQTSLSGGSAAANDKTVVGGVTVSGHAVTVAKKTMTEGAGISIIGATDKITIAHNNSITAGTAKGDDNKTLTFGGTFTIPTVTYDGQGHVTDKGTTTMTMPANPNTDIAVKQTAITDNVDYKILTTTSASPISGSAAEAGYGANLAYNPFTNTLKTGNASLTGTLNVTGQAIFNQIPVSITPEATSNNTSVATTAFVKNAIGGLSGAMHFRGTTTTAITDGSTTNPITISGDSYIAAAGDVVLREVTTGNIFEYVWTGSAWEMLGRDTNFKVTQTAVLSPTANGNTTAFIDTISQDTNGNITVTKKNLDTSGTWSGISAKATAANLTTTQNAIVKYSNTTGSFANSGVTIDSNNNITTTGNVTATELKGYVTVGQATGSTLGEHATAEGYDVIASGDYSHAEGCGNGLLVGGVEGVYLQASGTASHAEGWGTTASGDYSHAENDETTASGEASHAEGYETVASGTYSHAEGYNTIAARCSQHTFGEYNIEDTQGSSGSSKGKYIEIVGNGTANARSNARTLDWSGNEVLAGKLTVGINPTNDMDVATKQYVDNTRSPIEIKLESPGYYVTYQDTNTNIPHTGPSWAELYAAGIATKEIHLIIDNDNNKERFTSYSLDNNEKIFYFFTAAMPLNMIGFYCIEQNNTDYKITYKSLPKLLIV